MKDKFNFIAFAFVQNKLNAYQLTHFKFKFERESNKSSIIGRESHFIALAFVHTS